MAALYPESDKLGRILEERSTINEFVEWLSGQGIQLCSVPESMNHTLMPISESSDSLVMRMFGIDPAVLEKERRAMLESMARANDFNG